MSEVWTIAPTEVKPRQWYEYRCIPNIIFYISYAKSINAIAHSVFIDVLIFSAVHFSLDDVFYISPWDMPVFHKLNTHLIEKSCYLHIDNLLPTEPCVWPVRNIHKN